MFSRCDAPPGDLDNPDARRRLHEKTDQLNICFDPGTLRREYGIRENIVASSNIHSSSVLLLNFSLNSHLHPTSLVLISMN